MTIESAKQNELESIKNITHLTIKEIYPHYYAKGAVNFFLTHHSKENIMKDLKAECVFLLKEGKLCVGTVTIKGNSINRLFVLKKYQGRGYGTALLDFAEQMVKRNSEVVHIDASLPSKEIYLTRGYKEIGFRTIPTSNGDFLCYDEMEKLL